MAKSKKAINEKTVKKIGSIPKGFGPSDTVFFRDGKIYIAKYINNNFNSFKGE